MTCAALLAKAGLAVTVFERNERVGGKLNWLEADGYTWDTGPSLLTMPYVFERLWEKLGRRLEDDLTLVPLPVTCRYRWTDGTVIDEDAAFWERPDVARFLRYARGLYDLSADAFLHHPLDEWWRQLRWRNLPKLRHLPKIASFRTMDGVVRRFFGHDPHLVQLFDRFATYNGSSPYATPAAFNIIPYVEAKFGGWYVKGGLYDIARALERICLELGVRVLTGCEVQALGGIDGYHLQTNLERTGPFRHGRLQSGRAHGIPAPVVRTLLRRALPPDALDRLTPSISAFLLYLGRGEDLPAVVAPQHFLLGRLPARVPAAFRRHASRSTSRRSTSPSIPRTTRTARPAGCENWFVLVNAPALTADRRRGLGVDGAGVRRPRSSRGWKRVSVSRGCASAIRVRRQFTPADFETRYLANAGSLYGFASHGVRAAFQRPKLQPRGAAGFLFRGRLDPPRRRAAAGLPERADGCRQNPAPRRQTAKGPAVNC